MFYHPVFYKLLGIPEGTSDPTPFQLLGIEPGASDPETVKRALAERRMLLRQNIPGPQFIPMVSLIEKELDRAAALLLDPRKREAFAKRLQREAQQKKQQRLQKQVVAARQAVRETVNPDGTLPDDKRPALAGRLRALGLSAKAVRSILDGLPSPEAAAAETAPQSTDFFTTAVDLALSQGLLTPDDERKLLALAQKLRLPAELAARTINERLAARGARRGKPEAESLSAQFARQVAALHPDRRASRAERQRLVALAATQGLTPEAAERVLEELLEPVHEGAAAVPLRLDGEPAADEAAFELVPEEEKAPGRAAAAPPLFLDRWTKAHARRAPNKTLAIAVAAGVVVVVTVVAAILISRAGRQKTESQPDEGPRPATRDVTQKTPPDAKKEGSENGQGEEEPASRSRPEDLCRKLLAAGGQVERLQDLLVGVDASALDPALKLAADLLAGDPARYETQMAEGLLCALVSPRFSLRPSSREIVVGGLIAALGHNQNASRTLKLCLCDAIGQASDTALAGKARHALAQALDVRPDDPLRTAGLATEAERAKAAEAFRRRLKEEPVRPPTKGPEPETPKVAVTTEAIRAKYARTDDTNDLLCDVALTLLASCDRLARFTARSEAFSAELAAAVGAPDRAKHLARNVAVTFPKPVAVAGPADQARLEEVRKEVRSDSAATRYRAIEWLKQASLPEATAILLEEVKANAQVKGVADARTLSRLLLALRTKKDPAILGQLVAMLPEASSFAALGIVRALLAGTTADAQGKGLTLRHRHSDAERKACATAWAEASRGGRVAWAGVAEQGGPREKPPWQPDVLGVRLLATIALYAEAAADLLAAQGGGGQAAAPPGGPAFLRARSVAADGISQEVLRRLDANLEQLARLVRSHPKGKAHSDAVERIERERTARTLASASVLQKAVVSLDAAGALLELLVEETDPRDRRKAALADARREWQRAAADATNVLREMRESGYHNLVLCDLLLENLE